MVRGKPSNKTPFSRGVGLADALLHQTDHDLIGHQRTRIHVPLGLHSERSAIGNGLSQDVARGQMHKTEIVHDPRRLRPLPRTGGAEQHDVHESSPVYRQYRSAARIGQAQERSRSTDLRQ